MRKDPKKDQAAKLCANSCYGKFAESENYSQILPPHLAKIFSRQFGADRLYGKYTNFAYAAFITENVRLKLWRMAHKYGAYILATDGIITASEIPSGNKLGEFSYKGKIKKGIILGCGRYLFNYEGGGIEAHFRGFGRPREIFKDIIKLKKNYFERKILDTKSLKQWNYSIEKGDFNVLKELKKIVRIEDNKRFWIGEYFPAIADYFKKEIKSRPWEISIKRRNK